MAYVFHRDVRDDTLFRIGQDGLGIPEVFTGKRWLFYTEEDVHDLGPAIDEDTAASLLDGRPRDFLHAPAAG